MKKPDWRKKEDYNYTSELDAEGWAWEFLRRNPEYVSAWKSYLAEADAYGKELGSNWRKDSRSWRYTPPLLPNEKPSEWSSRCIRSEADFEDLQLEDYCGKNWGLIGRMIDPSITFPELTEKPRFMGPISHPKLITDDIEFSAYLRDGKGELPYKEVERHFGIIAFDFRRSIDSQISAARKILVKEKELLVKIKNLKITRTRRNSKSWLKYLRVLDARADGAKLKNIGLELKLADSNVYPDQLAANQAKDYLNRARRVMKNHMDILLPKTSKKEKS